MVPCGGRLVLWTWVFMFDLETGEQESRMVRWDAVVRCGWRGLLDGPGAGEGATLAEAGLATCRGLGDDVGAPPGTCLESAASEVDAAGGRELEFRREAARRGWPDRFAEVREAIDYAGMYMWAVPGLNSHFAAKYLEAFDVLRLAESPPTSILEVGSFAGANAIVLAALFPGATIHCVDAWEASLDGEAYAGMPDVEALFDAQTAALVDDAGRRLSKTKGRSARVLGELLDSGARYDLVYVDGSHALMPALADVVLGWRLLRPGGAAMFDDYGWAPKDPNATVLDTPTPAYDFFWDEFRAEAELRTIVPNGAMFVKKRA